MFILFFCVLLISLVIGSVICLDASFILSVNNLLLVDNLWEILLCLDLTTISIYLMLSVCFGYALFYTNHYFMGDPVGVKLNKMIILFVGVMALLTLTSDIMTTLVFWEYLGVVSFFLILFYSNYLSLRSSVITLVASRFGDVCLFLLIALSCYNYYNPIVVCCIFFFIIITKSAGFPFVSWLLEAMRAPTPVSSLVHSSTLVAAGVWFAMRYDMFNFFNDCLIIISILLLTIFITGTCCFFFLDLKKIVALSTCNNISWCLFYLLCGDVSLSLFQLVSHGVSKCLLFMLVGDVMSGSAGSQASNCVYAPRLYGNWGLFGLFSIILGLSGAPFIGVFFTKHFLLSNFSSSSSLLLVVFVYLCVFLSYFYSFRLCSVLSNLYCSSNVGVLFSFNSGLMVYFWLFINYYIASSLDETTLVGNLSSAMLMLFQLASCFTAYLFYNSNMLSSWSSSLFGCDNIVESVYDLYASVVDAVSLFYFRWDSYTLGVLQGNGVKFINLFNLYNLNFIMF
uniref:NADH:ubiquinone reductase (H(+)-translocating) n=1 Tax=Rhinebothrium reydai TaxID=2572012 RepID=A0A5B9RFN4_9CEST|nr:NADH dehydrogenase subunit 5 [Rhinebothrium reydai]QEG77668.1 NADH dehydrogenase subunit 5 [Rhinebothrium reydai]